jgi:hypothetical protein
MPAVAVRLSVENWRLNQEWIMSLKNTLRALALCLPLLMTHTLVASDGLPSVDVIRVPNGGSHPQVKTDSQGRVHLIYFSGDPRHGDIFYIRSADGGTSFSRPLRVNSQPRSAMIIGTVRGPYLAIGKGDSVHVAWMGSDTAEPKMMNKGPMLYTRLDGMETEFEPQRNVIQSHPGLDGGGSVAADHDGNVYVAWHAPDDGGDAEADRQVWITHSGDNGKSFDAEIAAIPRKTGCCGCCNLAIAAGDNGRVLIAFRSATEMVHRDMHLLVSKDHGKTFEIKAVDPWQVGFCVMSTAAFATANDSDIAVWETREQIRIDRFDPKTGNAAEPISIPGAANDRKHPAVAVNDRRDFIVAWSEGTGWNKGGSIAWQVFDKEGHAKPGQSGHANDLPVWGVPAVFATRGSTFKVVY